MPGKVKVKIISGKNLPVMDRSSDTTDAYVEIKLGGTTYKTDVCRKSLHPQWNSEWYRFEVDDSELQDEPLQIRLMDHDTYSANDAIGKVYLNLNPLLLPAAGQLIKYGYNGDGNINHDSSKNSVMSGWIPVYDTMHGIRGEVNIIVKVELFSDFNKFRQSSCGVQFFVSPTVPQGYYAQVVHGFVEELIVNDDPEYQWIDKIRTPRASNEARQTLFFKLSGELQRKIGVKALNLGGTAVIGYTQQFDLEGESGIVARGIGTAVTLVKTLDIPHTTVFETMAEERALNYLKFVGCNKTFRLCAKSNQSNFFIPYPTLYYHHTKLPETNPNKPKYKQISSKNLPNSETSRLLRSAQSNPSLTERVYHPSFKTLLKQEDRRGTSGHGLTHRIRNLKYSSQSSLSKKMTALKAKLGETGIGEEIDEDSPPAPEITGVRKKKLFKRTHSASSVMAEVLARSVINVHNSLSCILEAQNTPPDESILTAVHSEGETLDKLKPLANLLSKTCSEPNIPSDDNGSVATRRSYSSSDSTSSDYDDYDEENVDEDDTKQVNMEFDTISTIITNVEMLERNQSNKKLKKQYSLPVLPIQHSRNSSVDYSFPEKNAFIFPTNNVKYETNTSFLDSGNVDNLISETICRKTDFFIEEDLNPTDFLEEVTEINSLEKNIAEDLDSEDGIFFGKKFVSHAHEMEKLNLAVTSTDESTQTSDDHDLPPVVSNEEISKSSSFLTSKIIIPPVMIGADIKPKGLIKTAMQTMLLEKVNIMGTYTPPTSPTLKADDLVMNSPVLKSYSNSEASSISNIKLSDLFSQPAPSSRKLLRSTTSVSFSEFLRKNDTVLGIPFTSLATIKSELLRRQISHPCLTAQSTVRQQAPPLFLPATKEDSLKRTRQNCFSESHLHKQLDTFVGKPLQKKHASTDNIPKHHKFKFFHLLGKTRSHESSLCSNDIDNKNNYRRKFSLFKHKSKPDKQGSDEITKKKFSFFHRDKKHASSEIVNQKEHHHRNVLTRIFHIDHDSKEIANDEATVAPNILPSSSPLFDSKEITKDEAPVIPNILLSSSPLFDSKEITKDEASVTPNILLSSSSLCDSKEIIKDEASVTSNILPTPSPLLDFNEISNDEVSVTSNILLPSPPLFDSKGISNDEASVTPNILPTSQPLFDPKETSSDEASVTPNILPFPPPLLICTNDNNKSTTVLPQNSPVNTEIEPGPSCSNNNQQACLTPDRNNITPPPPEGQPANGRHSPEMISKMPCSPAKQAGIPCIHRRSSDSDLSITPKGNSLTGSDRSGAGTGAYLMRSNIVLRSAVHQENFDMLEYPFLTMSKFPPGFIVQLGGAVSARSVKLLERITNVEEPESRDTWWSEIRMEIRSHARSLNCNAVLGYAETTSICEDVCVLSASGTAAVIGFHYAEEMEDSISGLPVIPKPHLNKDIMTTSLDRNNFEKEKNTQKSFDTNNFGKTQLESPEHALGQHACTISHLPFDANNVVRATVIKCALCSKGKVPDVLIATIEPPEGIPSTGRGCFLESFICRPLKDLRGESIAKDISDGLPFLEYEIHRLLVNKLKIKGMNAIFGLKIRISIGEKMLIGIATGTAIFLASLPSPVLPKLVSDRISDEKKLAELQKLLQETIKKNREIYQLKGSEDLQNNSVLSDDNDDSEDEPNSLDLLMGNKDCCVLEVDDPQDAEVVNLLMEERPPDGFHVVNTEFVPGLEDLEIVKNLQMFTQMYRAKLHSPLNLNNHFRRLLQSVYFKLRRMVPCALCDLQFRVDLPEPDEIQICVIGMALGLGKSQKKVKNILVKRNDEDLIFKLDEEQIPENGVVAVSQNNSHFLNTHSLKYKQRSPSKNRPHSIKQRHIPYKERHGVDITPLSYVPGGKIERYLGNLNFFFIRETTSIREEGGLSGFIHSFITEILAIVRAHVTALGGNAMVAYFLTECVLNHNLHKNQGQCLINVGGDVVYVSYFKEDP